LWQRLSEKEQKKSKRQTGPHPNPKKHLHRKEGCSSYPAVTVYEFPDRLYKNKIKLSFVYTKLVIICS
jgi:hypothetical protein